MQSQQGEFVPNGLRSRRQKQLLHKMKTKRATISETLTVECRPALTKAGLLN